MIELFLLNPFLLIGADFERKWIIEPFLPQWNQEIVSIVGLVLFTICGIYMLAGRIQLGRYATGKLSIQEEHELIENGLYKYVRNPIYGGGIVGGFFFLMIYNALLLPVINVLLGFYIFNQRVRYEEKILVEKFGAEYVEYKKRTKKYIPFIY